jgi:hypothetical protein
MILYIGIPLSQSPLHFSVVNGAGPPLENPAGTENRISKAHIAITRCVQIKTISIFRSD